MRQGIVVDRIAEEFAFKVHANNPCQMGFAHGVIETGARTTIRQLAAAFARAAVLGIELAAPRLSQLFQFLDLLLIYKGNFMSVSLSSSPRALHG